MTPVTNEMHDAEFCHPRLVEIYELECPWSRDDDWFLAQLRAARARRVLDFGCGTGRLASGLAHEGFEVTGIDPAPASLAVAEGRSQPPGRPCRWLLGSTDEIPGERWDAVLMTSHVAQFLVTDETFEALLRRVREALAPNGLLCFDSRDPDDAIWRRWTPEHSRRKHRLASGVVVDVCTRVERVVDVEGGCVVDFVHRYDCSDGVLLQSASSLRFRSAELLAQQLSAAGFEVIAIDGGWAGEAVGAGDGELLVRACRR